MRSNRKQNIDKIQSMTIEDWYNQARSDEHITPTLCFMCVGCEKCGENCAIGIKEYLEKETGMNQKEMIEKIKKTCKREALNCDDYEFFSNKTCNNCPSSGICSSEFAGDLLRKIEKFERGEK